MLKFIDIAILDIALLFVWQYLRSLYERKRMIDHFNSLSKEKRDKLHSVFDIIDNSLFWSIPVTMLFALIVAITKTTMFVDAMLKWALYAYTYIIPFSIFFFMQYKYAMYIYAYFFEQEDRHIQIRYFYDEEEGITYYSRFANIEPKDAYYKYFITEPFSVGAVAGEPDELKSRFGIAFFDMDDDEFVLTINKKTESLVKRYITLDDISCYLKQPKEK